ncbi:MAG: hypothetical protein EXR76_10625 [Myxococcales bacterium]|nr:hypothetical protein [Myxococcales bacterium]
MDPNFVPNFSWVLSGRLAGSGMPARGSKIFVKAAYEGLAAEGVRLVVSLLGEPPAGYIQRAITEAGLDSLHFPIVDLGTPQDVEAFAALIDQVHERITEGTPTLVHCYAGIGRAGMFLAAYLARHGGFGPDAAIAELRRLRPSSIETHGQVDIIRRLAKGGP